MKRRHGRTAAVAVTAILFGLGLGTSSATATPAVHTAGGGASAGESAQACSTWQYRVKSDGTIRTSPGGTEVAWALTGDLVNVHEFSGSWYKGDFYYPSGTVRYYTGGWILSNHLDYLRCW